MSHGDLLRTGFRRRICGGLLLCLFCSLPAGCVARRPPRAAAMSPQFDPTVPREQNRVSLSRYRVSPPDILLIEAVNNIRPAQSPLQAGDQVIVRLQNGLPLEPGGDTTSDTVNLEAKRQTELQYKIVNSTYTIASDGTIDLGPTYGQIAVAGLTVDQAKVAIARYLHDRIGLAQPKLSVLLADMSGKQIVAGQHLVRPDGTVGLGIYGDVHVSGLTLAEIRQVLEQHLSQFLANPQVSVDVLAYNSKVYYVVMDGGGYGEQVIRLPCTGNETVLDAISQIQGLSQVSSKQIWIARPCSNNIGESHILCVNWEAITAGGISTTNYQLLPNDRIYVRADPMIATDNFIAKLLNPVERIFGFTLLGTTTAQRLQFYHQGANSGGGVF